MCVVHTFSVNIVSIVSIVKNYVYKPSFARLEVLCKWITKVLEYYFKNIRSTRLVTYPASTES